MKLIELWFDGANQDEYNEVLESMTTEELKDLNRKMKSVLDNTRFDTLTDRLIAKDFFIKGFLASSMKILTEEEKKARYETLRTETSKQDL